MSHTVGVLLDRKTFMGIPKGKTGSEKLSLYNQAAKQHKLTAFYTSLHQIGAKSAQGYIYTKISINLHGDRFQRLHTTEL